MISNNVLKDLHRYSISKSDKNFNDLVGGLILKIEKKRIKLNSQINKEKNYSRKMLFKLKVKDINKTIEFLQNYKNSLA